MKSTYWFGLLVCILLALGNSVFAQESTPLDSGFSFFVAPKFNTGYIIKNDARAATLVKGDVWVAQLDFSILKNTQHAWNYCNCYTKTGGSLSYVDFHNPTNLGHAVNFVLFTEPYLFLSSRMQFSLRGGAGLSYLNKIYDAQTNPDNIFYSKHISFLLMLNANVYYAISPRIRFSLSAQFNHISNGGIKNPNWGINFPTVGLGVEYVINPQELKRRQRIPITDRSVKLITHFFSGTHTVDASMQGPEEKKIVVGYNFGFIKPLTRVNGLGLGGEFYYDGASSILQDRSGQSYSSWIGSISVQHHIFLGKLIFSQQLAYYITPLNPNVTKKFYQRYILEYNFFRSWYAGFSLKARSDVSDYISFTLARMFSLK